MVNSQFRAFFLFASFLLISGIIYADEICDSYFARTPQTSIEILNRQDQVFISRFNKTSGFKTYDDYLIALEKTALSNSTVNFILKMLEENQYEFAMDAKSVIRDSISEEGFLNLHTTNTSNGNTNIGPRLTSESNSMGIPMSLYSEIENSLKPKYGYLKPSTNSGFKNFEQTPYGDDTFIFKKEIQPRVTYTIGDSLNRYVADQDFSENWEYLFIPWKYKESIVPSVAITKIKYNSQRLTAVHDPSPEFSELGVELFPFTMKSGSHTGYIELQYHGALTLDDVDQFEFFEKPPSGKFLEELEKRKIKIFDKRNGKSPPVLWQRGDL